MTRTAPAGTTPAVPLTRARMGTSTERLPRWRVRSSEVSNSASGGTAVDRRVPSGMKMSAGAGVLRPKMAVPTA